MLHTLHLLGVSLLTLEGLLLHVNLQLPVALDGETRKLILHPCRRKMFVHACIVGLLYY